MKNILKILIIMLLILGTAGVAGASNVTVKTPNYFYLTTYNTTITLNADLYFYRAFIYGDKVVLENAYLNNAEPNNMNNVAISPRSPSGLDMTLIKLDNTIIKFTLTATGTSETWITSDKPQRIRQNLTIISESTAIDDFNASTDSVWFYDGENIRVKIKHSSPENVQIEYTDTEIVITGGNADNVLIDRDVDLSGSGAVTRTTIYADVEFTLGYTVVKENVFFAIRDKNDAWVDNKQATDNLWLADNKQRFWVTYNSLDNILADSQLGLWDVDVFVFDNSGNSENSTFFDLFAVDDLLQTITITADNSYMGFAYNFPITVTGTIARISGLALSGDNSWLEDENKGTILNFDNDSYTVGYTISAAPGTKNVYVRLWTVASTLDGENYGYYDVNDNQLYEVWVYWEETYSLVPDGSGADAIENRNFHLTFFTSSKLEAIEYDMTTNPENFVINSSIPWKVRLDFKNDNYWRVRRPSLPGKLEIFAVENTDALDRYEFILKDFAGGFGLADNGEIHLSRYIGPNKMNIHEDFWESDETLTIFMIYGAEYSIKLVGSRETRIVGTVLADRIQTKEIRVNPTAPVALEEIWDEVGYAVYWENGNLKVTYLDNTGNTTSVTLRIYNENDVLEYSDEFTANSWTLTWTGADNTSSYIVELEIVHATLGFSTTTTRIVAGAEIEPAIPSGVPGLSQLGTMPFAWGSAFAVVITVAVALTFGAKHAGFSVLTIALMLVVLGPMLGIFDTATLGVAVIALIAIIGVMIMMSRRAQG